MSEWTDDQLMGVRDLGPAIIGPAMYVAKETYLDAHPELRGTQRPLPVELRPIAPREKIDVTSDALLEEWIAADTSETIEEFAARKQEAREMMEMAWMPGQIIRAGEWP